ncbi:CRISPR-associated helicase/endonuclease Cas3 [Geobacter pickeringii]|uniref:CRISPR-associated helicase/endonuclease Cas3 n=1 Tax=Geobacter pickeringii TaxID=345632 RepID=UPI00068A482E|nr:CRISPR-associated helicase/endonuclease Cas3 [Geobacter pickeringii]
MEGNHGSVFVARYRRQDGTPQTLLEHLEGTSVLASLFAGKIGLPALGALMGLLHDFGKYSKDFQTYIKSSAGKIEPDDDDYVDSQDKKGKIDHSSAGAQYLRKHGRNTQFWQIAADMMSLCIVSHHSGLIDCLAPDGTDVFNKRMQKPDEKTHYGCVAKNLEENVWSSVQKLLTSPQIEEELRCRLELLRHGVPSPEVGQFMLGFLVRFLFSTLIDADRLNSAERKPPTKQPWQPLIDLLETHLSGFTAKNRIDEVRADISRSCLKFAAREKGLFQLTVPTGGGKTLASLRFGLHHAAKHQMDRIIYVVPYTSIIDQNARVARSVFAPLEEGCKQVVLEHHSNLTPEQDTDESKLLAENWDAPIIYTTAVQFLETLFAAGTRGVRRLHQLANAVIIFDEIQTIPIRTVHLFNNAINFLVGQCGSTAMFCTATQPLLDRVEHKKGAARLSDNPQIMRDVGGLFRDLHRTKIENRCKDEGWTEDEVAETALEELDASGSVLIIVNKKAQARELYRRLQGRTEHVHHLSTSMCPAHRTAVLDKVKVCLDPQNPSPVICISTQLIEAGVDVDFGTVIRYLSGIDSIAQAAGRCNRNGLRETGRVLIVNAANEGLDRLPEIRLAQDVTKRVLREFEHDPAAFDYDLQSPKAMECFYHYYFFQRAHEMAFPVSGRDIKDIARNDDLLNLLSINNDSVQIYLNERKQAPPLFLRQSFMSAARAFKAIDSPTEGVIVPYAEGEKIIAKLLCAGYEEKGRLLKEAQRYSVNLFPHEMKKLKDEKRRLYEVWKGSGVYYLDERHYSEQFGVSTEEVADMKVLIVSGGDNEEPY